MSSGECINPWEDLRVMKKGTKKGNWNMSLYENWADPTQLCDQRYLKGQLLLNGDDDGVAVVTVITVLPISILVISVIAIIIFIRFN